MRNLLLPGIGLWAALSLTGCLAGGDKLPISPDNVDQQHTKLVDKHASDDDNDYIFSSFVDKLPTWGTLDIGSGFKDFGWDMTYRHWNWFGLMKDEEPPPPPAASVVLRGDGMEPAPAPQPGTPAYRLAGAHEWMRQGQHARAEAVFHRLADNEKNPPKVIEEARYYEAECLRLQKLYPEAADTYADLMTKFPNNPYREQAVQHMYTIANYWLEDTRARMNAEQEVREKKRWFVWNQWVHLFDSTKPVFDEEGRAVELLEKVQLNDLTGPLSDQALYLCGAVKMYDENFAEADYYFSQIHERHPNSPLAEKAVEYGIISKHLSTGGSDYDGRKAAEARILVNSALNNYPGLASEKQEFLMNQLKNISYQQAEKDYKMAEFWARTGHPGSAYFYFELVRRRYPGTEFAEKATKRRDELRAAAEKEESGRPAPKIVDPPYRETPAATITPQKTPAPDALAPPVLPPDIRR